MTKRSLLVLAVLVGGCNSTSTSQVSPGSDAATARGGSAGNGSGGPASTGGTAGLGGTSSSGGSASSGGLSGSSDAGAGGGGGLASAGGATSSGGATGGAKGDAAADVRSDLAVGTGGGAGTGGMVGDSGGAGTGGVSGTGGTLADAGRDSAGDARTVARDSGSDPVFVTNPDVSGDSGACPYTGHVTYTLAKSANPTAAEQAADDLITPAMNQAIAYYNCYTNITKSLSVSYVADSSVVPTADGNTNGSIRFGPDKSYMEHATAMHEIGHAVGIGNSTKWSSLLVAPDGGGTMVWSGTFATAELRAITGVATDVVKGDSMHFWPYGLNYASEWHSEADGIAHCRMVMALRKDMGM